MITISAPAFDAYSLEADQHYSRRLAAWLSGQPELRQPFDHTPPEWCGQSLTIARRFGIESEDDVARFARVRLLRGDDWLMGEEAQAILASSREGQLKVFQLECLHLGVRDG
ncbi:hypothetical protein HGI47_13085 [Novosphingobium sp. ERN07]|uniref:hypothetical protein n=1 Tax=Novosphingobium sp. ERN07 TaxID=2726187 RepID=UPI0014563FF9|nr:hypothetical protein [Novosphingobium sp. ERN07]NLR71805.1 hypothetical protein [Novosphingobium sp. ERN07]